MKDATASYTNYDQPTHWATSGSDTGSPGAPDTDYANDYVGWRWGQFTSGEIKLPDGSENAALVAMDVNPDNDELNNFGEYAFGQNPNVPNGSPVTSTGSVTIGPDTFATITFTRRHKALDVVYDIQFSSDLDLWDSATVQVGTTTDLGNGLEQVTFRDTTTATTNRRFAKVTATSN